MALEIGVHFESEPHLVAAPGLSLSRYFLSTSRKLGAAIFLAPEDVAAGRGRLILMSLVALKAVHVRRTHGGAGDGTKAPA